MTDTAKASYVPDVAGRDIPNGNRPEVIPVAAAFETAETMLTDLEKTIFAFTDRIVAIRHLADDSIHAAPERNGVRPYDGPPLAMDLMTIAERLTILQRHLTVVINEVRL